MSSSRRLGLHSERYSMPQASYKHMKKVDTLSLDGDFIDIAGVDTGQVWINCWPAPELSDEDQSLSNVGIKCRRWGRVGTTHAAVMPFRMTAGQDDNYKIHNFRIDLVLDRSVDNSSASYRVGRQNRDHSTPSTSVHLLDIPQPQKLLGRCKDQRHESASLPWKFCSRSITDPLTGKARTARWTWTSNNNDPEMLHGAIIVGHPGQRFYITCSVQGQAYKGRTPFKFSNQNDTDKIWFLDPKIVDEDLRSCIESLESQIIESTVGILNPAATLLEDQGLTPVVSSNSIQPRTFGSSIISGTAQVHQGDKINNYFCSQIGAGGHTNVYPSLLEPYDAIEQAESGDHIP